MGTKIENNKIQQLTIHDYNGQPFDNPSDQSKDEILKARFAADTATQIKAFCRGRKISVTDFLRRYARLGDIYFDHVETLLNHKDLIVPLLERIAKQE